MLTSSNCLRYLRIPRPHTFEITHITRTGSTKVLLKRCNLATPFSIIWNIKKRLPKVAYSAFCNGLILFPTVHVTTTKMRPRLTSIVYTAFLFRTRRAFAVPSTTEHSIYLLLISSCWEYQPPFLAANLYRPVHMGDHQGRPGSAGIIRFKTSFANTIYEAMKKRGWRETNSNTDWDLIWVERCEEQVNISLRVARWRGRHLCPWRRPLRLPPHCCIRTNKSSLLEADATKIF